MDHLIPDSIPSMKRIVVMNAQSDTYYSHEASTLDGIQNTHERHGDKFIVVTYKLLSRDF